MTTPAPRLAHHAEIHVGGDTAADLADAIREIADRLDSGEAIPNASGGVSRGYWVTFDYDPDMTHDRYVAANLAWLEARRAGAGR